MPAPTRALEFVGAIHRHRPILPPLVPHLAVETQRVALPPQRHLQAQAQGFGTPHGPHFPRLRRGGRERGLHDIRRCRHISEEKGKAQLRQIRMNERQWRLLRLHGQAVELIRPGGGNQLPEFDIVEPGRSGTPPKDAVNQHRAHRLFGHDHHAAFPPVVGARRKGGDLPPQRGAVHVLEIEIQGIIPVVSPRHLLRLAPGLRQNGHSRGLMHIDFVGEAVMLAIVAAAAAGAAPSPVPNGPIDLVARFPVPPAHQTPVFDPLHVAIDHALPLSADLVGKRNIDHAVGDENPSEKKTGHHPDSSKDHPDGSAALCAFVQLFLPLVDPGLHHERIAGHSAVASPRANP